MRKLLAPMIGLVLLTGCELADQIAQTVRPSNQATVLPHPPSPGPAAFTPPPSATPLHWVLDDCDSVQVILTGYEAPAMLSVWMDGTPVVANLPVDGNYNEYFALTGTTFRVQVGAVDGGFDTGTIVSTKKSQLIYC